MDPQAPYTLDPQLTAVANVFTNPNLIHEQVLPIVEVDQETFKYLEIPRGEHITIPETLVGNRGLPNEVDFTVAEQSGIVHGHALKAVTPRPVQEQRPTGGRSRFSYDPRARAVQGIRDLLEMGVEKNMADTVFNANNYAASNKVTLAGTDQWSDNDSDPLRFLLETFDGMMFRPNVGVIGRRVATKLMLHPKLVQARNNSASTEGKVTLPWLADMFGLEQLLVGDAYYNEKNIGQDVSLARVWGNYAAFLYRSNIVLPAGNSGSVQLTWGATFVWPINGQRYGTFNWFDPEPGVSGVDNDKVSTRYTHKVIASDMGYLVIDAVA